MKKITKEEFDNMKYLKASFRSIDCNFNLEDLEKRFAIFNYAKTRHEQNLTVSYLTHYVDKIMRKEKIKVENIDLKYIKENISEKSVESKLCVNKDMVNLVKKIPGFTEIYSDWTNQFIGYEAEINDGIKILVQPNKKEILTTSKKPIIIDGNELIQALLRYRIIYLEKQKRA